MCIELVETSQPIVRGRDMDFAGATDAKQGFGSAMRFKKKLGEKLMPFIIHVKGWYGSTGWLMN